MLGLWQGRAEVPERGTDDEGTSAPATRLALQVWMFLTSTTLTLNNGALNYVKWRLITLKREIDKCTVTLGEVSDSALMTEKENRAATKTAHTVNQTDRLTLIGLSALQLQNARCFQQHRKHQDGPCVELDMSVVGYDGLEPGRHASGDPPVNVAQKGRFALVISWS